MCLVLETLHGPRLGCLCFLSGHQADIHQDLCPEAMEALSFFCDYGVGRSAGSIGMGCRFVVGSHWVEDVGIFSLENTGLPSKWGPMFGPVAAILCSWPESRHVLVESAGSRSCSGPHRRLYWGKAGVSVGGNYFKTVMRTW